MLNLIEPKEVTITTQAGTEKTYIFSKIPAIPAREIITQYPISSIPKLGDYKVNEQIMFKLLSYVSVKTETGDGKDHEIRLTSQALINNHVPDWETLARIEMGMMEYNCSFFQKGVVSTFLEAIAQKVPPAISKILMGLQAQSSPKDVPPSNS